MDEMNMHVTQNEKAVMEVKNLMAVSKNILDPQCNKPSMGLVQDALVGSYLLTRNDTFIEKQMAMDLLMCVRSTKNVKLPPPAIVKPRPLWTGKQIFSMVLPHINLERKVRGADKNVDFFDRKERVVLIRGGVLLCGAMCKQTLGLSSGGVIHLIALDFDGDRACVFMSDIQRIVNEWLARRGFSVGLSDFITSPEVNEKVQKIISRSFQKVRRIQSQVKSLTHLTPDEIEVPITGALNQILALTGGVSYATLDDTNRLSCMTTSGSKGSQNNVAQITACVGQQAVEGRRIQPKMRGRTLACFDKDDPDPRARGFVTSSYIRGLNPKEFFFHAMGGREGLVDTAVKTAETGYAQRRMTKAMESLKVQYDRTVRDEEGLIVDFLYGSDGFDPTYLEGKYMMTFLQWSRQEIHDYVYEFMMDDDDDTLKLEEDELMEAIQKTRALKITTLTPELAVEVYIPVAVRRVITNVLTLDVQAKKVAEAAKLQEKVETDELVYEPLSPTMAEVESLVVHAIGDALTPRQIYKDVRALIKEVGSTSLFFRTVLLFELTSSRVLQQYCLNASQWASVLSSIRHKYYRSLVNPGEMVGTLAAESLGSQTTQMTLNTFHSAGIGAKNVTLGVPRLKELIDVAKTMRIPSLTLYLKEPYANNEEAATEFCNSLVRMHLSDVVNHCDVVLEPNPLQSNLDPEIVDMATPFISVQDGYCRWVVRIQLIKRQLLIHNFTVDHVTDALQAFVGDKAQVISSTANMENWVVLIRLLDVREMTQRLDAEKQRSMERALTQALQTMLMSNVIIGGIKNIENATIRSVSTSVVDETLALVTKKQWVVDTVGSALSSIWALPAIDWARTYSNDINEMCRVLGIEAAIHVLFQELKSVLAFDGSYINDRHIMMVVNTMSHRGYLMPLNRHGMNRLHTSVLKKASFEESMDMLLEASTFGTVDNVRGVSERIMVGRKPLIGTNSMDVIKLQGDGGAKKTLASKTHHNDGPIRTVASVPWLPWESAKMDMKSINVEHVENVENVEHDKLDRPPPSPVLRSMMPHVPSISQEPTSAIRKPYQDLVDGVAFTPTIRSKGVSIQDQAMSPGIVPMVPNARGYQIEPMFTPATHLPTLAQQDVPVVITYRPSSPVLDELTQFSNLPSLALQPPATLKLPVSAPVLKYSPSSPDINNEPMEITSDNIAALLSAIEASGSMSDEPVVGTNTEEDMMDLRKQFEHYMLRHTK